MKRLSPLKAIRKNCLDCSGGSPTEATNCVIPECPLYEYRLGTNPRREGVGRRRKATLPDKPAVEVSPVGVEEIGLKTPTHEGGNEQGIDSTTVSESAASDGPALGALHEIIAEEARA